MSQLLKFSHFLIMAAPAIAGIGSIFLALKPIRLIKAERMKKEIQARAVMQESERRLASKPTELNPMKSLPPPRERTRVRMRA
jgi:hypothetical protein